MFSKKNSAHLEKKGLSLFVSNNWCSFLKEIGKPGNSIPNWTSIPIVEINQDAKVTKETVSDCPLMSLSYEEGIYRLRCWEWVPGPGPGDFELIFDNESAAFDFVESYYFGNNPYFQLKLDYYTNKKA
jgi:hypothetical protein